MDILDKIIDKKRQRLNEKSEKRSFIDAVKRRDGEGIKFICELKKASPSKGLLRPGFNVETISAIYQEKGASAVSVLTEEDFFHGHISYLETVKNMGTFPVLRKDFIIDKFQIYESLVYGADAILLIASSLSKNQALEFLDIARSLSIDVLFEIHNRRELDMALSLDVEVIGINNRNLKTLTVDLKTTEDLVKDIPKNKVIVSESGIKTRQDVEWMEALGVHALLIGTALMQEADIGNKLGELMGG